MELKVLTNGRVLTWGEILDILDGSGLVITDYDEINNTLDNWDTGLDKPTCALEVMSI